MSEIIYSLENQQTQKMILSQQQMQSLKLLELDAQELDELLQKEFAENPALEWSGTGDRKQLRARLAPEDATPPEGSRELYSDEETRKNFLIDQLERTPGYDRYKKVFRVLLDWMDEDGLFRAALSEFCAATDINKKEVQHCLSVLQELDPPGVFAPDIPHCLMKQAQQQGTSVSRRTVAKYRQAMRLPPAFARREE